MGFSPAAGRKKDPPHHPRPVPQDPGEGGGQGCGRTVPHAHTLTHNFFKKSSGSVFPDSNLASFGSGIVRILPSKIWLHARRICLFQFTYRSRVLMIWKITIFSDYLDEIIYIFLSNYWSIIFNMHINKKCFDDASIVQNDQALLKKKYRLARW